MTIHCPKCGFLIINKRKQICSSCGQKFETTSYGIFWRPNCGSISEKKNHLFRKICNQLNLLNSWASPLRWLTEIRTNNYYNNILKNPIIGKTWVKKYLNLITLKENMKCLDFGCGRGRVSSMLNKVGLKVYGQDISEHCWWGKIGRKTFQVVPSNLRYLPWPNSQFDLVVIIGVLHYLTRSEISFLFRELSRVLSPSGYIFVMEANNLSYGKKYLLKQLGKMHSLPLIKTLLKKYKFKIDQVFYEGFYAPYFPALVNFCRKILNPRPLDLFDSFSYLAKITPRKKRGVWWFLAQNTSKLQS